MRQFSAPYCPLVVTQGLGGGGGCKRKSRVEARKGVKVAFFFFFLKNEGHGGVQVFSCGCTLVGVCRLIAELDNQGLVKG